MSRRLPRNPRPSTLERDLTRLADGTLDPERRELVEPLVASTPALQRRLSDQRLAVAAVRSVAERERAPLALRLRHRDLASRPRPRWRLLVCSLTATLAALGSTLALVGGGSAGLTVAQAATLAARPPLAAVREPREGSVTIPRLSAAGLPFPYWADRFGWQATGVRTDRIGGRATTTVFYRRGAQQIAYTIVSGHPLTPGRRATTITAGGRHIVTWQRRGHTCVLSGQNVPVSALRELATWRGDGRIPY